MQILVADDHQLFIDGIRHILAKLDTDVAITESNNAARAIEILESGQDFDLVLIDLSMPGMDRMSILQRMRKRKVWLPLVVISAEEDARTIKAALDAGALGFIPKAHSSQQMLAALHTILEGDIYIPANIQKRSITWKPGDLTPLPQATLHSRPAASPGGNTMSCYCWRRVIAGEGLFQQADRHQPFPDRTHGQGTYRRPVHSLACRQQNGMRAAGCTSRPAG